MTDPSPAETRRLRLGCVSFLNARPLIDGLDEAPDLDVRFDVPSRLLDDLISRNVDLALCPVIDYQRSAKSLLIVPVGGIACDGPTLTVRLFSRRPLHEVDRVHADTDSHSSVALLRVVLQEMYGHAPEVEPFPPDRLTRSADDWPDAVLLIGDKVVVDQPSRAMYPHQLDLGQAWKELTDLPFVFAVWMARRKTHLADLPARLERQREHNRQRLGDIVARHAPRLGWPPNLAAHYLGRLLRYEIGPRHLQAMERFWQRAAELELIDAVRPLRLYDEPRPISSR